VASRLARAPESRGAAWRAVRNGARGLAVVIAVAGVFAVFAFDAAFEVFHRLFFSAGTYTFDPATSRLIQLFPEQFWSETTIAVGVVVIAVALLTAWLAGRRASRRRAPVVA
jgi:integral membrane protein (TIGR01906 family)